MEPVASRAYHHGDLDRAALDAAETLLREGGEAAVVMREVARRVGVAHRALYRWRPDRQALLAGLAERGFRRLAGSVRTASEAAPDAGSAFVQGYLRFTRREPALYRLAMSRDRREFASNPSLKAAVDDLIAVSRKTFGSGKADDRDAIVALWALLHGAATLMDAGMLAIRDDEAFVAYAAGLSRRLTTTPDGGG